MWNIIKMYIIFIYNNICFSACHGVQLQAVTTMTLILVELFFLIRYCTDRMEDVFIVLI